MRGSPYVLALAWKRIRRRSSGALLAAAGIAVGTAVLVGVFVGTKVAQDRSASQAVARIPAATRSVRAVWFGVPTGTAEALPVLDRAVLGRLADLGLPGPTRIALFRESTVAGHFVSLGAVDGLAAFVILRSGRLPRPCTPARCEVLRLRGAGTLPSAPGLRLVEVGTATLRSRQLFGDFLAPTDNALADRELAPAIQHAVGYHRPPPAPLVVADGVAPFTVAPPLAHTYRSYAWVWPLSAGAPRLWELDALVARAERARAALGVRSTGFSVQAPVEELRAGERATSVAGRRLLLVGGEAAALLFAFAVLAARTMRRDLEAARRRLTWSGARRSQLTLLTGAESAFVGVSGTVGGWLVGLGAGALAAALSGAPVGPVLRESALSPAGLALAGGVAVLATLVIALSVSARSRNGRGAGALDAAALAAVAVVIVALLGGVADESRLAGGQGAALVLLVLPGLIAFAAAVASARLFGPGARLVGRLSGGRVALRLSAVTLGRGPGVAAVTVAFLVLAFALSLLAEGYRATLARGEEDQAAFQVPLDAVVREDLSRLVPVLDAAPLARYRMLGGGVDAVPVLRLHGGAGAAEDVGGVTVLGLPPATIEELRGWRPSFAAASRSTLAAEIAPATPARLHGIPLAANVVVDAGPGLLTVVATVAAADGTFSSIRLGALRARARTVLRARVPARLRGALLVALELVPPPRLREGGAEAGHALEGTLELSGLHLAGWIGEGGVVAHATDRGVTVRYRITPEREARLRARQPTDTAPPMVLATPRLAGLAGGVGGELPLALGGERIPVRVAGVIERFPGVSGEAVVGDLGALGTAIDTRLPGAGRSDEIWLDIPSGRDRAVTAELVRPPFLAVESVTRRQLVQDARRDPLGHGTLLALAAAALVALLLAAVGLLLTVLADLRDDRGDLYDLEAQGAAPSLLRRVVRLRALVVALCGIAAGVVAGALLTLLVTRVVAVTARATAPDPPLRTAFDLRVVVVGALAYVLVAGLLVVLATRAAFRDDRGPARVQGADP